MERSLEQFRGSLSAGRQTGDTKVSERPRFSVCDAGKELCGVFIYIGPDCLN